jgi:hypothetical protein
MREGVKHPKREANSLPAFSVGLEYVEPYLNSLLRFHGLVLKHSIWYSERLSVVDSLRSSLLCRCVGYLKNLRFNYLV